MQQTPKNLHYSEYSVIQKGFGYCQHEANSKVLAQFYAILSVSPSHRVVGYCKHGANCKETALFLAIKRCGKTNFS